MSYQGSHKKYEEKPEERPNFDLFFLIDGFIARRSFDTCNFNTYTHMYINFLYDCIKDAQVHLENCSAFTSVIVNYANAIVAQLHL